MNLYLTRAVDPKIRLLAKLEAAGLKGMSRTEILKYLQYTRDRIDQILADLLERFLIVEQRIVQGPTGRPKTRYWHKDHVPDLTVPAPDGTSNDSSDPDSLPPGGTCRQCGGRTPIVNGRPQDHCSDQCRELAKTGGVTCRSLLAQATDPRAFVDICALFVMADLRLRGYHPTFDVFRSGPQIVVTAPDGAGTTLLVMPVPRSGVLPPLDEYASVAVVYNDGRIRYAGKYPLVTAAESETEEVE